MLYAKAVGGLRELQTGVHSAELVLGSGMACCGTCLQLGAHLPGVVNNLQAGLTLPCGLQLGPQLHPRVASRWAAQPCMGKPADHLLFAVWQQCVIHPSNLDMHGPLSCSSFSSYLRPAQFRSILVTNQMSASIESSSDQHGYPCRFSADTCDTLSLPRPSQRSLLLPNCGLVCTRRLRSVMTCRPLAP